MTSGGRDLSFRVVTGDQSTNEQVSHELIFKHFRKNKVEIATAVTMPFPFLMSLRDQALISEQMYENFQDACTNLVPVTRVVYDVLNELEKTFHPSLLKVLFSKTNLQAYPNLNKILRSFQNVSHEYKALLRTNGADTEEMPRVPSGGGKGSSPASEHQSPPRPYLEICDPQTPHMTNRGGEKVLSLPPDKGGGNDKSDFQWPFENSDDCVEMSEAEEPQETSSSPARHGPVSCDPEAPQMTDGDAAEEGPSQAPCHEEEESGELQDYRMNEEGECEELPSSPLHQNKQEQSGYETEKCSCVMCCPKVSKGPEARTDSSEACDPAGTSHTGTNSILGKPKRKRRKKKGHNWTKIKKKKPQNIHQKGTRRRISRILLTQKDRATQKRVQSKGRRRVNIKPLKRVGEKGFRYPKNYDMNFDIPELPVTCTNARGTLIKEVFKQGVWKKSIRGEDGRWFTPREFEVEGNRASSKNWKLSVRCHGWTLRQLIQLRNSDECEVCRDGGTLFCCDTCSRAFHEYCHLPPVEAEKNPWSCIFCRIESFKIQQHYQESEILERQMQAEEQLKCELLLLKVYCCSESSFFTKIPYYYYNKEPSEVPKEHMWLDKIKTKLTKKDYAKVEGFVQDMRLIFQNHRTFFKDPEFGQMGLTLEAEFEKNFKEVFAIQETNESS
ncbi:PREDICTED: nuclear body protein SP140 isoform X2 [Chinchilla lanigera]|uniref:nuclear body protein SP140 isoform X2 n=1 Tax=Chinchilla lanigera TaxID=34839 RepID=UPI000698A3B6|nr:PREDICTED: nuclear body protein SP140 isoform X2 [Chinchilla lanigera]